MKDNQNLNTFSNTVLSVKNVCKNYGNIEAVSDISFSLEKSQTLGLLGSNGAGKTTTLEMLEGFKAVFR